MDKEIQSKLVQYRYHLTITIALSLILALFSFAAPRFLDIIAYFWPLFASTTVVLVMIMAFGGGVSRLATEAHGEKAGEGLLDYVAGRPEYLEETHKFQ